MLKNWRVIFGKPKQVRIRPWLSWLVAGGISLALIMWLSDWGTQVSRDWVTLQQNPTDATKKKFDASLEVVKAIVGGVGTVATIGGGFFVFWNVRLTQTRLITERFSKAVEQLGSEKIEVRLGGIYALERIAQDSDRDHWTIMEVLTSFIQEKTSIKRFSEEKIRVKAYERWQQGEKGGTDKQNWDLAVRDLAAELMAKDIQAALTVIGRRKHKKDPLDKRLDFNDVYLIGANLRNANLGGAIFRNAALDRADLTGAVLRNTNLGGANLKNAILDSADFTDANFTDADLRNARLDSAVLTGANFTDADFRNANLIGSILDSAVLTGADFRNAKLWYAFFRGTDLTGAFLLNAFLDGADFRGANLSSAFLDGSSFRGADFRDADFRGADPRDADFRDADFGNANFRDADFRGAKGITPEQIKQAKNWQEARYDPDLRQQLELPPEKP